MNSTEIVLSWENHDKCVLDIIQCLYNSEFYCDCTLVCSEGFSVTCHRIVLSSSSPYFKKIIQEHPLDEPVILLPDVSKSELYALLELIYTGSVSIPAETFQEFVKVGVDLQIANIQEFITSKAEPDVAELGNCSDPHLLEDCSISEWVNRIITDVDAVGGNEISLIMSETVENFPEINYLMEAGDTSLEKKEPVKTINKPKGNYPKKTNVPNNIKRNGIIRDLGDNFEQRYQCEKCGKKYSHKRTALHHIHWICGQPATYFCPLCSYRGKRKFQLRSHLEHVHDLSADRKSKIKTFYMID